MAKSLLRAAISMLTARGLSAAPRPERPSRVPRARPQSDGPSSELHRFPRLAVDPTRRCLQLAEPVAALWRKRVWSKAWLLLRSYLASLAPGVARPFLG